MSWSQSHSIEPLVALLERLTHTSAVTALTNILEQQGIKIVKTEDVVLDDDMFDTIHGERVILSDGRVFVQRVTEKHTWDGNSGLDVYTWCEENESTDVKYFDDNVEYNPANPLAHLDLGNSEN